MKNLTWQNPEQLFVAQELINKVKSKCCGIKVNTKAKQNQRFVPLRRLRDNDDAVKNALKDAKTK